MTQGLGEVSTNRGFAGGNLLAADSGTSFAAPHVANLATRILVERPDAPPELLRALLLAHASVPPATTALIPQSDTCRSVVGYGVIDRHALFRSLENDVSLVAVETIANKRHHFYELPVPEDFLSPGRRDREIAIALAYTPAVRSTRVAYKATRMDFKLVAGPDIEHVSKMFSRATEKDDYENIPELKTPDCNGQVRGKGTVQKATWRFRQFNGRSILKTNRLFVVVTRNDHPWGDVLSHTEEPYALVVCLRDRANESARTLHPASEPAEGEAGGSGQGSGLAWIVWSKLAGLDQNTAEPNTSNPVHESVPGRVISVGVPHPTRASQHRDGQRLPGNRGVQIALHCPWNYQ